MYGFAAGFVRFIGRVTAYCYLIVDAYPPFDGGEHPGVPGADRRRPAGGRVPPPEDVLPDHPPIPVDCIQYVFSLWLFVVAVAVWFCGVFAGRTSPGVMEAMRMPMAYYIRANAYLYLVTEDWPPFDPGPPRLRQGKGTSGLSRPLPSPRSRAMSSSMIAVSAIATPVRCSSRAAKSASIAATASA